MFLACLSMILSENRFRRFAISRLETGAHGFIFPRAARTPAPGPSHRRRSARARCRRRARPAPRGRRRGRPDRPLRRWRARSSRRRAGGSGCRRPRVRADRARRQKCGRELGRRLERAGAGAELEVGGLEFQRHGRAGQFLGLQARRDFLGQAPENAFERAEIATGRARTWSPSETLLVSRSALTMRASMPRARRQSRRPSSP